jgi:hypothetical protein
MKAAVLAALLFLAAPSDEINLTATSVNVAEPGTPVKIRILRWSTDAERTPLLAALNPAPAPTAAARNPNASEGATPAARGRAGRGRGRGGPVAPVSPIGAFTVALGRAPTIGYIWTNDNTGYAIKYAWHASLPDGERIILALNRRLGAYSPAWALAAGVAPTDYEFTVVELRLGTKGPGEGKASLTAKVAVDTAAQTVALEDYGAATPILQKVRR